jgi:Cof subfamily protein (haloacid dehalogenase superfamily)
MSGKPEQTKSLKDQIKMVFCDVDETLVAKNSVPECNREAISNLRKNNPNVKFVLATGRPFSLAEKIIKEIDLYDKENEYTICGSGSVIYENKNKKVLYAKQLQKDFFQKLFDFGKKFDIYIFFVGLEYFHYYKITPAEIEKRKFENAKYKILPDDFNLDDLLNGEDKILRMVYGKENAFDYLMSIQNELKKVPEFNENLDIFISSGKYLEINPKGVNKGVAVKWLCDYLKVEKNQTMGIGDADNDVDMIKNVGFGCAVKGSKESLKKIVDYICEKDYDEGAVKEVIDKFLL